MAALHCLSCEHANSAAAKYCAQCGSALNLRLCEKCEAINQRSALRCHSCDAPLAVASAARRPRMLVALASAAVVGLVGAAGALYLLDRTRLEAAQVRATPPPPARPSEPAPAAVEAPAKAKPAARIVTVTHTRATPAAPARAAEAERAPIPTAEDAAPPVTHTRRAVVAPDTKTGSN